MAIDFSTKAETLISLSKLILCARIAPLLYFTVAEWRQHPEACCLRVVPAIGKAPWIVRSSCHREDTLASSQAGAFETIAQVDEGNLRQAIQSVIDSYGTAEDIDQILIQPMLENVLRAGVAFSHDPGTGAPYRVVNWAEGSDTAAITSGNSGRTWQQAAASPVPAPENLAGVLVLLDELLQLFNNTPVDCEFAVTEAGEGVEALWLLQVRPLLLQQPGESVDHQSRRLTLIQEKLARGMRPQPFLMGKRTVYGVMPDWNPAEIIGARPRPLSLSLYRELVTDAIWAYQRHNYGYRNLRSFPLMPHFFGQPYVDVRLSFNSFIPADLEDGLAGRLVDYYIDRLIAEPGLHDKVEFEIVHSCYTLDLSERLETLAQAGFSREERTAIADSLRRLTNRIMHPKDGLWRSDAGKLDTLAQRREALVAADTDPLTRIYWLLEDAKRYGTLPFAGLARAGFISVQLLDSLVAVGLFSKQDYYAFLSSVSTVSGQLTRDRANLDRTTFLARYGHLRPGTYDILSPRYDEAPDLYFDWNQRPSPPPPVEPFHVTLPQMRDLVGRLESHGLHADPVGLFDFLQAGIEYRELAKFHFTRNLSDALALIAEYGSRLGFTREELAYADINVFKELHVAATDPHTLLSDSIEQGKRRYRETSRLSLPPLITQPTDVWAFEWPEAAPNFVTQKQVTAPVCTCQSRDRLAGSIVMIPNADPGFDWLFAYPIAGLITAWGGANSHMAIRAGELGLPAVIGTGEVLFRRLSGANQLFLDCAGRRVEVLS